MKTKEKESIGLDEITFIDKNKAYGAYELRSNYVGVLNQAFIIGLSVFLLMLLAPHLFAKLTSNENSVEVILHPPIDVPPPVEEPINHKAEEVIKKPEQPKTKFLTLVIGPDELIEDITPPPTQDMLAHAPAGSETVTGDITAVDDKIIEEKANKEIEVVTIEPEKEKENIILEQQPYYPGGIGALTKFLSENMKYPRQATNANVSGKVFVSFVVDKTGEVSDISITKGIGFGCDEEAERVIKLMKKWIPGKQSGKSVKSRFNMPISFVLE